MMGINLATALLSLAVVNGFVSNRTERDVVTLQLLGGETNSIELDVDPPHILPPHLPPLECPPCLCLLPDDPPITTTVSSTTTTPTTSTASKTTSTTTTPSTISTSSSTTTSTTTTSTTTTTTSGTPNTTTTSSTATPVTPAPPPPVTEDSSVCLTESCVMAAGTILTSLDRTVDPCTDFYQYACGGWAQRSLFLNTDRFQVIDKRNQNIIRSILESPPPANVSEAEQKTRTFYKSCTQDGTGVNSEDLINLQAVIDFAGGWNISGEKNMNMTLDEKMYRLHNQLGVSVLFSWGVVTENNTNHIAIVPGGWNEDYLDDRKTYLKLMAGISWMLQEAAKCPPVEYEYDVELNMETGEMANETVEVEYEYEYGDEIEVTSKQYSIFQLFGQVFWPSNDYVEYDHPVNISKFADLHEGSGDDYSNMYEKVNIVDYDENEDPNGSDSILLNRQTDPMAENKSENNSDPMMAHKPPPTSHLRKTSRQECLRKLQSEVEMSRLSSMVSTKQEMESLMRDIVALEDRLRNITTAAPGFSENTLKPYTMKKLEEKFGFVKWTSFFSRAFNIVEFELEEDTPVMVDQEFLIGVSSLVSDYMASPHLSAVLSNYLTWRLVATFYPSKYQDEARRREQCLRQTEDVFGPALTAMYVRHKTVEATEIIVEEVDLMVDTMKEAFRSNLGSLAWMSNQSRASAGDKLDKMMDLIGYPEQVLNSTWLNEKYAGMEVTNDYLMNIISFQSHERKEGMKEFIKQYQRGTWAEMSHGGSIVTVNAFYSPSTNTMIVPIGMLQDPLYWRQPKSLTFGAFGIVVAHEITHAFDDTGINYDGVGMMSQLYDNNTINNFRKEASCLRNQYSQFSLAGAPVDGNLTLGENLADHGGLNMALAAYNKWRASSKDSRLPALDFNDMQLFFLGYALPWCSTHTTKHAKNQLLKDEHAPERFRVLGPLSNSREFAEAWNCPVGSQMNPQEKCRVW